MQTPTSATAQAIHGIGGPAAVARLLIKAGHIAPPKLKAICHWRDGRSSIPPTYCATIGKVGGVPRWELRPLDWHLIWPELVGTNGAPRLKTQDTPQDTQEGA